LPTAPQRHAPGPTAPRRGPRRAALDGQRQAVPQGRHQHQGGSAPPAHSAGTSAAPWRTSAPTASAGTPASRRPPPRARVRF
jgi:hypothetical protein